MPLERVARVGEMLDIVARICGICPIAYQALGIVVEALIRLWKLGWVFARRTLLGSHHPRGLTPPSAENRSRITTGNPPLWSRLTRRTSQNVGWHHHRDYHYHIHLIRRRRLLRQVLSDG
jgi:hypothetical protein